MIYTEAKEKISAMLDEAKAKLEPLGIGVECEIEVIQNPISATESEPLLVLGSLALSAEGFTEDDTYYISIEAKVEGGECDEAALEEAKPRFTERVDGAYERLSAAEDRSATLLAMGKEIDEELERMYAEEVAREQRLMRRDLKTALIGAGIILGAALIAFIVKALMN